MATLKGTLTPAHTVRGEMSIGGGGITNYEDLENKPQINGVELIGNKTSEDLGIDIPTKTSDLENDSGFVTSEELASVATSGDYNDLENKPTIPAAQEQSDWNEENPEAVDYIKNKPSLAPVATSGDYGDLNNKPTIPTKTSELDNDSGFAEIDDNSTANNKAWSSEKTSKLDVNKSDGNVAGGTNTIKSTTGANNTAFGVGALQNDTTGGYNVGIGRSAGSNVKTGSNNTIIGYGANTTGESIGTSTAVGKSATAGEHSTALGANTGATGSYSVAVGDSAKAEASSGVAIGRKTKANYVGSVAIGTDNLGNGAEATDQNMIALGTDRHKISVLGRFDSTRPNTVLGDELAPSIDTWSGTGATWNGSYWAMSEGNTISTTITLDATSDYLIALTVSNAITPNAEIKPLTITLENSSISIFGANDANWNVVLSTESGGAVSLTIGGATWSGRISNVSVKKITDYEIPYLKVGYRSLHASGTNVVFGTGQAKIANANYGNVAIGYDAQRDINTGIKNVAVGLNAQRGVTNGSENVAVGDNSQRDLTTGMYNTTMGCRSMQLLTSGCWNVGIGNEAIRACATGTNNVAVGRRALDSLEDGHFNTVIGAQAGFLRDGVWDTIKSIHSNEQAFYGFQATQYASGQQDKACAFGSHACSNENGLALGAYTQARGNGSVAIGMDSNGNSATATNDNDFVLGTTAHRIIFGDKVIKFNNDNTVTWEQLS